MANAFLHQNTDGSKFFCIPWDEIVKVVATRTCIDETAAHVREALRSNEDFQILIQEAIRDSMAKLNMVEVVKLAIKDVLEKQYPSGLIAPPIESGSGDGTTSSSSKT